VNTVDDLMKFARALGRANGIGEGIEQAEAVLIHKLTEAQQECYDQGRYDEKMAQGPNPWPDSLEDFAIRGKLAAGLQCWHRLTSAEAENLVEFFSNHIRAAGSAPDCWVVVKDGMILGTHDEPAHIDGLHAVRYVPAQAAQPVREQSSNDYMRGFNDGMKEAPTGECWIRVIDEAMVGAHIGVADMGDDYGTAKEKLNSLICWSVDVDRELNKPAQPVRDQHYIDIERTQGFPDKLDNGPQMILYSDSINGCMVRRDDVWLALTSQLQSPQPVRKPLTFPQLDAAVAAWFKPCANSEDFIERMRSAIEAAQPVREPQPSGVRMTLPSKYMRKDDGIGGGDV
jgi:hypothetical protein